MSQTDRQTDNTVPIGDHTAYNKNDTNLTNLTMNAVTSVLTTCWTNKDGPDYVATGVL